MKTKTLNAIILGTLLISPCMNAKEYAVTKVVEGTCHVGVGGLCWLGACMAGAAAVKCWNWTRNFVTDENMRDAVVAAQGGLSALHNTKKYSQISFDKIFTGVLGVALSTATFLACLRLGRRLIDSGLATLESLKQKKAEEKAEEKK